MPLELYNDPASLCSQKVRLTLAEKGIAYESRLVDIHGGENLSPDYIKLNPKAVVPTLVHDGEPITGSATIVAYIDEKFTGTDLGNGDPRLISAWIRLQDMLPIPELTYGRMQGSRGKFIRKQAGKKIKMATKLKKKHSALRQTYELKIRLYRKLAGAHENASLLREAETKVGSALDSVEEALASRQWLAGNSYTIADAAWTPVLVRLRDIGMRQLWAGGRRPNVAIYFERLRKRPSFSEVYGEKAPGLGNQSGSTMGKIILLLVAVGAVVAAWLYVGGWDWLAPRLREYGVRWPF